MHAYIVYVNKRTLDVFKVLKHCTQAANQHIAPINHVITYLQRLGNVVSLFEGHFLAKYNINLDQETLTKMKGSHRINLSQQTPHYRRSGDAKVTQLQGSTACYYRLSESPFGFLCHAGTL